ncbi:MAG: hypothetical protein WEC75_03125 [Dehalococcoidia bacterium]
MSVLAEPRHPLRLAGVLAASAAATALVLGAALAAAYIVRDLRGDAVAPAATGGADFALPEGMVVVSLLDDAGDFRDATGFKPLVPKHLPATTDDEPHYAATQPDARGVRVGQVRFASKKDAAGEGGITGPTIVLVEAKGAPGEGIDEELKRIVAGNARAVAATIVCGDLVVDVQLYFGPDAAVGEPFVTPWMTSVAGEFVDGLREQCGG